MLRRVILLAATGAALSAVAAGGAFAAPPQVQSAPAAPYITGDHAVGALLAANTGTWSSDSAVTYSYQWQRCAPGGVNCADVSGATDQTYPLTIADALSSLRVVVTATNADGSNSATSAATEWINNGIQIFGLEAGVRLAVPASSVSLPNTLFIDNLKLQPGGFASRAPVIARIHVSDQHGANVVGALVKVSGLPSTWATTRIEAVTSADGWAWLRIFPTSKMPLTPGHQIALVVRARVPGTSGLAATSVRRVFQAPVH